MGEFNFSKRCCFCGGDNTDGVRGYAGERTCSTCGKGGYGEPDEQYMAYRVVAAHPCAAGGGTNGHDE